MMKRTVELGFFLALALILAYVESLIPFSLGIPGIKLGLPNLIVLLLLYRDRMEPGKTDADGTCLKEVSRCGEGCRGVNSRCAREALTVNALRIVLSGFLFSNLYTILYALAGALLSFAAMCFGRRLRCFSVVGVSVLGGVFHNIGQILMAMLVVETFYVGYYVPFLIVAGTVTGAVLGFAAMEIIPYLRRYERSREGVSCHR